MPSGTGAAPGSGPQSAVRATQTVKKTFNYTLIARPVPPGFDPTCPEVNLALWGKIGAAFLHPDPFSFPGGEGGATINVPPCNAATGDSMHALLEIQYGHMRFIATGNGNFKLDSVDDSGALLTVTDNTTGTSVNTLVYIAY
jgi:hypothetical protein